MGIHYHINYVRRAGHPFCVLCVLCTVCTVCILSSSAQIHLTSVSISEWLCNIGDQQQQQQEQRDTRLVWYSGLFITPATDGYPAMFSFSWVLSPSLPLCIPTLTFVNSGAFSSFLFFLRGAARSRRTSRAGQMHTDGWAAVPSFYSISIWIYTAPVTVSSASRFIDPTGGISTTTTTPTAGAAAKGDVCVCIQGQLWSGRK